MKVMSKANKNISKYRNVNWDGFLLYSYTGSYKNALVTRTGIEPMIPPWEGGVLTAWPTGHKINIIIFIT